MLYNAVRNDYTTTIDPVPVRHRIMKKHPRIVRMWYNPTACASSRLPASAEVVAAPNAHDTRTELPSLDLRSLSFFSAKPLKFRIYLSGAYLKPPPKRAPMNK
jgi:hypothetical protein